MRRSGFLRGCAALLLVPRPKLGALPVALPTVGDVAHEYTPIPMGVTLLDPVNSPLTELMMKLQRNGAYAAKVKWLEDETFPFPRLSGEVHSPR